MLETTNANLVAELRMVNQKLKDSESMKDHFVSNVRNEIINPFSSIIGLSKNIITSSKEDWKRVITMTAMIHSEAFNLDLQLRNIFMAAKIEAGDISPEINHVDISRLVSEVIEAFSFASKKKKIKVLHLDALPAKKGEIFSFRSDAEKLRLILSNLVSNAIKYSHESGVVKIISKMEDSTLVFAVEDKGTGISEANQKVIFDRFKKLDSGINSLDRGHGIGLSVNKALIDILEGNIKINSLKDEGSDFIIYIPESMDEGIDIAVGGDEYMFQDLEETELF
ncbi:MAG: HAMP domain-containing histidine kinase [Bacteroidetes bacterium]|nr:HAMP domain-containing histidine kinase [Bacteroidota bacterium]